MENHWWNYIIIQRKPKLEKEEYDDLVKKLLNEYTGPITHYFDICVLSSSIVEKTLHIKILAIHEDCASNVKD